MCETLWMLFWFFTQEEQKIATRDIRFDSLLLNCSVHTPITLAGNKYLSSGASSRVNPT